jgi:hypothetical protein
MTCCLGGSALLAPWEVVGEPPRSLHSGSMRVGDVTLVQPVRQW